VTSLVSRSPKAQKASHDEVLARWNAPGIEGFEAWLADIKPRILKADRKYSEFVLEDWQRDILARALACDEQGQFVHSLALTRMPRRHSKSTLWALVVLWLATSRENLTVSLLGNSELHSTRTQFAPLKRIIARTKALSAMIPPESILKFSITVPHTDSMIQGGASGMSTAFGDRIGVLWCSDFHQVDADVYDALQGSLLDSQGTMTLIDANADRDGGPVHSIEKMAAEDPQIFCCAVEYSDFADYCDRAPSWIDRKKAAQLQRTQLDIAFQRDVLGKRSAASNALFLPEVIAACVSPDMPIPFPVERLPELTGGRKYVVGGGLDRSKKLFGGDSTVWTVTMKVSSPNSLEPEYFILNQQVFPDNSARSIKKAILADHDRYNVNAVTLENYEVADLKPWVDDQGIPCEIISATNTNQNVSFTELHRIAKENRLHFSDKLEVLKSEMLTFAYEELRDGNYKFGHSSQKFHDDCVYSTNWSVFATRAAVLSVYALKRIVCDNMRPTRNLCFLMGGDMELLCKENCRTYHEVREMYRNFLRLRLDDEYPLPVFFENYVKLDGARVYQGV